MGSQFGQAVPKWPGRFGANGVELTVVHPLTPSIRMCDYTVEIVHVTTTRKNNDLV